MSDKSNIDSYLKSYLSGKSRIMQAVRYSVFAGGKRLRPVLCLAAAKALRKNPKKILPIAAAIEMLHAFTLIHDDLPAMDNSDLRRGKPSCHKQYDEATAILAGDALNTLAFRLLAEKKCKNETIQVVADALMKVVAGQVMDLSSTGKRVNFEQIMKIHEHKTAALIIACVSSVAIELGANKKMQRALENYARHLGLAFQIADDVLDVSASEDQLGKPVKADKQKGFPYFFGIKKALQMMEQEKQKAILSLSIFGGSANDLRKIAAYAVARRK